MPLLFSSSTMTPPCLKDWGGFCCQRSEEHTSELQSQSNIVCRLLLGKKKACKTSDPHRIQLGTPCTTSSYHALVFSHYYMQTIISRSSCPRLLLRTCSDVWLFDKTLP